MAVDFYFGKLTDVTKEHSELVVLASNCGAPTDCTVNYDPADECQGGIAYYCKPSICLMIPIVPNQSC